jgi:nucleoside-diphosphate-sugar epimerase
MVTRHLIVTGANGYIGGRLVAAARARGHTVTVLTRRPSTMMAGVRALRWTLSDTLPPDALAAKVPLERHTVIHLAHDWTEAAPGPGEGALNITGTGTLLEACRALKLGRFVFVSSQSARADAANVYGRVKWRIEQMLAGDCEVAARVGLVYGGPRQGLYGLLVKLTARLPVLPMIDPFRPVQPIHVDEVCEGLLRMAEGAVAPGGWVGLAGPEGVPFGDVLRTYTRELHGKRLRVLPIPLRLALLACDVLGRLPKGPKPDRERVLGLAGTRPMPCAEHLAAIGLTVVPLATGLRREAASRRARLAEGRLLLRYVLLRPPSAALLRRYVRALPAVGEAGALPLNRLARAWPSLLRLLEPIGPEPFLGRRLALALAVVEASPEGEQALASSGRAARIAGLVVSLTVDALLLPARMLRSRLRR